MVHLLRRLKDFARGPDSPLVIDNMISKEERYIRLLTRASERMQAPTGEDDGAVPTCLANLESESWRDEYFLYGRGGETTMWRITDHTNGRILVVLTRHWGGPAAQEALQRRHGFGVAMDIAHELAYLGFARHKDFDVHPVPAADYFHDRPSR